MFKKGLHTGYLKAVAVLAAFALFFGASSLAMAGNTGAVLSGAGSALLFPYYDVRSLADGGLGLTDNYFTVTNTSPGWVQAHVRIRTGDKSVEVMDFDVLLSPRDTFAFDLYQAADGGIEFSSCDTKTLENSNFPLDSNGCFTANSSNTGLLSLIKACQGVDNATALMITQTGYVEVIGEGIINPDSIDNTLCASHDAQNPGRTIPGRTLHDLEHTPLSTANCKADITDMAPVLAGKAYYATVDTSRRVSKHAALNAWGLGLGLPCWDPNTPNSTQPTSFACADPRGVIIHANDYASELQRCKIDNGCFAYSSASASSPDGAADINMCFYQDHDGTAGIQNKYGGGKTFGPGFEDLAIRRDGSLDTIRRILQDSTASLAAQSVSSHFFSVNRGGSLLDMETRFAFVFPFKHFTGESVSITAEGIWDLEGIRSAPYTGFFSPRLPSPPSPAQGASLFSFFAPYQEGWAMFTPLATNKTSTTACKPGSPLQGTTCQDTIDTSVCNSGPLTCSPGAAYVPGNTGVVFTLGAGVITASPFTSTGTE